MKIKKERLIKNEENFYNNNVYTISYVYTLVEYFMDRNYNKKY